MGFKGGTRAGHGGLSSSLIRRVLGAFLAATALSLSLAPGADAKKPVTVSCGETITADTKLANDLIDCPEFGIVIGADNITLDLNGHTVDGTAVPFEECEPDCPVSVGIVSDGHDGVTVKGGSVREFVDGVVIGFANDNHVRQVSLADQRHQGIVVHKSTDIRVDQNSVVDSGFQAIFSFGSHDVRIRKNVMARNGNDEVGNGILTIESDDLTIENNVIRDSHAAIQITESRGDPNLIAHNRLSANDAGIELDGTDNSLVTSNHVAQSGHGVLVFGSHNTITGNHIAGGVLNPDGDDFGIGLFGGEGNLIARNQVRGTLFDGIAIAAVEPDVPTLDTVVRGNRVRDARTDGISVANPVVTNGTVADTLIEGNVSTGSGDDGFDVRSAATTLTSNLAMRNGDFGIEAVPGVTDGGGNRAGGNGNPLQCTNVFCN